MTPLRVLMTNASLSARSGTETYTRDLALEFARRGHVPTVYSPLPGVVGDELRAAGVRVVSDLGGEAAPHVIHGHHHVEAMTAVLRFPGVPAVFVCHDRTAWHDSAPLFPRIRRYVAVDENCRERFAEEAVDPAVVRVIPNAVDLARFRPRGSLPPRPRRALLFSNYAAEHTHLPPVREACRRAGLELDVAGSAGGCQAARPEEMLGGYDVVFAKARCALEAMAVGCAVVLCDHLGAGPLVRTDAWPLLRPLNFGRRACASPLTVDALLAEVARYDATDAAAVCRLTRANAGVTSIAGEFLALYEEMIREQAAAPAGDEPRAAAEYLRSHLSYQLVTSLVGAAVERDHWKASADAAHRGWAELKASADAAHRGWAELHAEYELILAECRRLQGLADARRAA